MEYNFWADLLNKYSQLTPYVQVITGIGFFGATLGVAYFVKESIVAIMKPLYRTHETGTTAGDAKEWRDKYYRDDREG